MPFSTFEGFSEAEWTKTYTELFKRSVEEANMGYSCERSKIRTGDYLKDIIINLRNARVVIADITGHNPNVLWELGVRHALSKRTIVVYRKEVKTKPIISNLSNYGYIPYSMSDAEEINAFRDKIKELLHDIEKNPDRSDNPVFDHLREEDLAVSSVQKRIIRNNLVGLLSELSFNLKLAEDIIEGQEAFENKKVNSINRFTTNAVRSILASNYANLRDKEEQKTFVLFLRALARNAEAINLGFDSAIYSGINKRKVLEAFFLFLTDIALICKKLLFLTNKLLKSQTNDNFDDGSEPVIVVAKEEHRSYFEMP